MLYTCCYAAKSNTHSTMLTIYIPLPEGHRYPNDEDAWFLESLAELVDETLLSLGASVGGFETGPEEVGICVFGADPKTMATKVTPFLKRHCPSGTHLHTFYDDVEEGESEDNPLFTDADTATCEPLPVSSSDFAYSPLDLKPYRQSIKFAADDRYIFKAIATSPGISVTNLNDAIDAAERIGLKDDELSDGVARLQDADYIYSDAEGLHVARRIANELPRTAKGNVSSYRDDAWKQVYDTLF